MLKSRKENKVETITMILISKYIIRHIVPINRVKRTHVSQSSCYIIVDMKIVLVCCCMMHGEPLRWTGLA